MVCGQHLTNCREKCFQNFIGQLSSILDLQNGILMKWIEVETVNLCLFFIFIVILFCPFS